MPAFAGLCVPQMGQEMARRRDTAISEMRNSLSSGGSSASPAQRQRIEDLTTDVHEARQENERLSQQSSKLRVQLQVLTDPDPFKRVDSIEEGVPAAPEQLVNEDMLELRRVLWDLQQENKALKDENARTPEATEGTKDDHRQRPVEGTKQESGKSGGSINMAEYRSLQHQVLDLRKAYESAVAQTERLRARKASREGSPSYGARRAAWSPSALVGRSSSMDDDGGLSVEGSPQPHGRLQRPRGGSMNSDFTGSVARSRGGSIDSDFAGPTRLSHADSVDEDYGGRLSMPNSGTSTPAVGGSRGSHGSPLSVGEGDIRKKLQALQAENDKLKQKIRMLASN